MATDSTLQKIADNLLAQFDKTLLDNSTDFSSCDQILNAAPSEHKGGLESLYCDLLLDALMMAISYKKLWHVLLDRDMKKRDLQEAAGLTKYAMNKLSRDENVSTEVLGKICSALNCTTDDQRLESYRLLAAVHSYGAPAHWVLYCCRQC